MEILVNIWVAEKISKHLSWEILVNIWVVKILVNIWFVIVYKLCLLLWLHLFRSLRSFVHTNKIPPERFSLSENLPNSHHTQYCEKDANRLRLVWFKHPTKDKRREIDSVLSTVRTNGKFRWFRVNYLWKLFCMFYFLVLLLGIFFRCVQSKWQWSKYLKTDPSTFRIAVHGTASNWVFLMLFIINVV